MIREFNLDGMSLNDLGEMFEEFYKFYQEKHKDKIEENKIKAEKEKRNQIACELCEALDENLRNCSELLHIIKKYKFENEQFVLNWLDTLNHISVKH